MKLEAKSSEVLMNLIGRRYHRNLIRILKWILLRQDVVITSAYRFGSDIHFVGRAFDIRSWIYDNPESVVENINENWLYDYLRVEKKCAIFHDVGQGPHIHLQVHNNTQYIGV